MYLGIDLGTSSVKVVLIDQDQQVLDSASAPLMLSRPHDGWSEQAPEDWTEACSQCLQTLASERRNEFKAVRGIGLSGQMHGATLLDSQDQVIRPCILWNDSRSAAQAAVLDTEQSRRLTGNIIFPGFTAPKLLWLREHEPDAFERLAKVLLPKDYLRLWLSGEHVAEMSDAAGTGWLDVGGRCWSTPLLEQTGLDIAAMPRLVEGTEVASTLRDSLARKFGLPKGVVIAGGAGDNAASACGVGTVGGGSAFLSLGTSGVLFAANDAYRPNAQSAVHTFCHALPDTWHQMGVILAASDCLQWWSGISGQSAAQMTASLQRSAVDSKVQFLPYLGGERTPHNDAQARGSFTGLGHGSDLQSMTHAVLQGVSFAFRDCAAALQAAGTTLGTVTVIGGGSQSAYWLQLLADTLQIPLQITDDGHLGASLGAARLGLIAAESADPLAVCQPAQTARLYEPDTTAAQQLNAAYQRYRQTYAALKPLSADPR